MLTRLALPTLPRSTLLPLLLHLLHLTLQLLRLTPQHLLLPPLLERLRLVPLLLCQLFLPLRQRVQLRQRVIHLLRFLLLRRTRLRRLVLVLLRIQFQIKQTRQVTPRASTPTPAAATLLPKRHLNLPERRLSPQQRLQRFLLIRHRIPPSLRLQLVGRRHHRRRRLLHVFLKAVELFIRCRQIPALHAPRKRKHLLPQLHLRLR